MRLPPRQSTAEADLMVPFLMHVIILNDVAEVSIVSFCIFFKYIRVNYIIPPKLTPHLHADL
jgi:hypothetical protein